MKIAFKKALFGLALLMSVFPYLILPSYGMDGDPERIDSVNESLVLHHQKVRKLKNQKKLYQVTSLSSIERKLKGRNAKEQLERELRKTVQSLTLVPFDQNPKKDSIIVSWVKAAQQEHNLALYNLGCLTQQAAARKYIDALKTKTFSKNNSKFFILENGQLLEKGQFVYWSQKAQTSQNPQAYFELGVLYDMGIGVTQNYERAMRWYLKAAEYNHVDAQYNIGFLYHNGQGVEKDYKKAMEWYLKAAAQNDAWAQCTIGDLYNKGHGVEVDQQEKVKWYLKAAEQNDADAQLNIAVLYDTGYGVVQDHQEAMKWSLRAAERNPLLQYDILKYYLKGDKVERDYNKAFEWVHKAPSLINECSFNGYGFTDEDASQLASLFSCAKPLNTVKLNDNKLTSQGLKKLLKTFSSRLTLTELDLRHNRIDDEGGKVLLVFCERHPALTTLSLEGNDINEEIIKLIENVNILKIDPAKVWEDTFCNYELTDEEAPQLACLLYQANPLGAINLSGNKLTSQGIKELLKLRAFAPHHSLVELDVRNNLIDDEGGKELLSFIQTHPTLTKCDVSGNPMSLEMQKSIEEALKKNENKM